MRKLIVLIVLVISALSCVYADEYEFVFDDADLIGDSEQEIINKMCGEIYNEKGSFVYIFTRNSSSQSPDRFLEQFYDEKLSGKSAVLLIIDMGTRQYRLQGYGNAKDLLDDSALDSIYKKSKQDLTDGNYFSALQRSLESIDKGLDGYYVNQRRIICAAIGFIIGFIISAATVAVMVANAGGKMTAGGRVYINRAKTGLKHHSDIHINTYVTKTPKQSSSGGHSSSGSRRHSSGGGGF